MNGGSLSNGSSELPRTIFGSAAGALFGVRATLLVQRWTGLRRELTAVGAIGLVARAHGYIP